MPQPMAKYSLPSGAIFEAPSGLSEEDLAQFAMENFPDEFTSLEQPPIPTQERPRRGQQEPSLFGRFTGSFAEGVARGAGSVIPGIGAGFSDLIGDKEGFQESLGSIRENSASAAEFNPLPSSFAEVREKYRKDGIGSAMLEMADLAAQGTGGSLAYVAPSLAVVGLGTLGVLSAPATVLALGGTAVLSTVQYFSEQLDRAAEEAERKGEKLSSEDVNLAKQLAFAMGQTGLERASLLTTGLFKNVLKNEAVRTAANSAAAKSMLKFADNAVVDNMGARAVLSGLSEVVTETGQTAFERAAAGLPVAPDGEDPEEWQRAFDEYVETWVSAMLVGTGMGAAVGHLENRGEKHRPGIEEDVVAHDDNILPEDMDRAEVQAMMGIRDEPVLSKAEMEARAQAEEMDKRRRQEEINVISSIRKADETVADKIESKLGFISRKAKSENRKFRSESVAVANDIRKRERTVNDIYNLLDHRGVDYESSEDAANTLRSFIRRTAGVSSIEKATPAQLDKVYKAIESNRTGSNLAMPDVDIAANVLRAMSTKEKLSSAEVSRVASGLPKLKAAKATGPEIANTAESDAQPAPEFDKRTAGIISRLVHRGVVRKAKNPKTGKFSYSVPENIAAVLKDPDFDAKSDLIIELMNQREGKEAVRYPSFDELMGRKQNRFAEEVPDLVTREEYEAIKQIHSALGVDSSIQDSKRSAPPMRTEYERGSEPAWRWVVRDEDGNVRRVESSRKQAESFVAGNKDSNLKAPARERGYVVRENAYTGDGKMSRLVKSVPAHFVSASESDAKAKADAWVKQRSNESDLLLDEPHFLGTQTRGDKGSTGRVARLQRLAKSGNASDFKRAVKIVKTGRNPLSVGRVLKSYGFGVTEASEAAKDVWGSVGDDVTTATKTISKTQQQLDSEFDTMAKELASAQRDGPERAMIRAQMKLKSGHMSYMLEHVGDLTHRLFQHGTDSVDIVLYDVSRKVDEAIRTLESRYGFLRQHDQDMRSSEVDPAVESEVLKNYADAHRGLRVFNRLGYLARESAIALAEKRISDAISHLKEIQRVAQSPEALSRAIRELDSFSEVSNSNAKKGPWGALVKTITEAPDRAATNSANVSTGARMASEVDLKIPISLTGKIVKKSYPVTVKSGVLMPDGKGFGVAKISSHYEDWASTRYGSWRSALDKIVTEMGSEQAIRSGRMTVFPDGYGRVVAILQDPKGYVDRKPIEIDVEAEIQQLYMDAPKIERPADQRGDYRLDRDIDPAYHATLKKKAAEIRENAKFARENPDIVASRLAEKAEPITAIFDMVTDSRGNPSYHVVNMFVGKKNMDIEMWGPDQAKGHEPFYGRNASPRSIAIINGQSNPLRNPAGGSPATDVTFNSPILRSAANLKPAAEQKPNSIWKYINDAVTEWTGKPDFLLRLRRGWTDSYAALQKAEGRLVPDGHKEFLVNVGTMGMARNVSNSANMANSALFEGFIKWTPTGTVLDADQTAMQSIEGVFTTENFELNDQSEPILVLDPVARQMVKRVFKVDGMHSEKTKNKVGGFATIFSSTVSNGKNLSGQMFQYAMAVRAWNMLNVEGKDKKLVPKVVQDNMADWLDLPNRHPEIGVAYSNLQRLNKHTVELSVQSGLLSKDAAKKLLKNFDYTPFIVEQTGDQNFYDKLLGGVNQINPDMPYKGWFELGKDQQMVDPMQAFLGNFTRHVAAAVNNITRSRAIRDQVALGLARRWSDRLGTGSKITVKENGESVDYEVDDQLVFETIHGEIGKDWGQAFRSDPVLKWVTTKPSEWLRESVSRSPDFVLTNPIRDSLQVMMINSLGVKQVGDIWKRVFVNMGKAASGKDMSRSFQYLKRNGIITGWGHVGFQGSVKDVVADINEDLASRAEGRSRKGVQKAWDMLGRWSAASESASREIVFEDSYNYHRNELRADPEMSDKEAEAVAIAQALYDAREVLNFTRRGNNQFLKILLQLAPFTGARIQGLDIVGRAIFGYAPVGYKRMSADQVRRSVAQRAGIIASASAALAMLNYGDDDYENEDGYVRDMNWLFPIPGTNTHFALPIPFELGIISKVVPEQITRMAISAVEGELDKGQRDAARAARHAIVNTAGMSGFIPVVARPAIEAFSNKSIFTGRPIVPYYEQFKPTEEQFGVHTSVQARALSGAGLAKLGISPRLIDNEVRTIGGGLGVYAWSVMDHVARLVMPGVPNLPVPRMADTVGFKRFVKDEFSSGVQSELYEFQRELDQSFSRLKNASKSERPELTKRLQRDMAVRPAIHALTKRLKGQKDKIEAIMESDISIIAKRKRIDEIERSNREIFKLYREIRSKHDRAGS